MSISICRGRRSGRRFRHVGRNRGGGFCEVERDPIRTKDCFERQRARGQEKKEREGRVGEAVKQLFGL